MRESHQGLKKSQCDNIKGTSGAVQASNPGVFENPETTSVFHDSHFFIKSMLNTMLNPVCYKDRNGIYLGVNEIYSRQIAGLPEEEIIGYTLLETARKVVERFPKRAFVNGKPLMEHVKEWDRDDFELFKNGGKSTYEYEGICADGIRRVFLVNKSTFGSEKGEILGLITVLQDITERDEVQRALQEKEERYRSFIENFKGIAFQADENFIPQFLHGALKEITGYTEEEFMSHLQWKDIIDPEYLPLILEEERKIREIPGVCTAEVEYRIRDKKGKTKWVHETCQKIPGRKGKPEIYQGVIYDITEKKRIEENLAKADAARKKEIHHRIKNNLQVISSLLDLQAEKFSNKEYIKDSEVLKAFRESQDRVISIALIHEELHEGEGTDTLNFPLYLQRLVDNLFQTYRLGNANITLKKELENNIFFDMDLAVPLGLIVNELVSNSLKHAFSGRDSGEIDIKLCREKNPENEKGTCVENETEARRGTGFILTVSDDGTGISNTIDMENSDSLGLQLVNILVDQLEGEMEVRREKGTEFTIRISVAEEA